MPNWWPTVNYSHGDSAFARYPLSYQSHFPLHYPGTLPKMNKRLLNMSKSPGLALHCDWNSIIILPVKLFLSWFAKGLPGDQHTTPFAKRSCKNKTAGKKNAFTFCFLTDPYEEDAGKSLHDVDDHYTLHRPEPCRCALLKSYLEPAHTQQRWKALPIWPS